MSVYDITEHADFVFSAGDVVVRVAKNDSENEAAEQGAERPTPCVGQVGTSLLYIENTANQNTRKLWYS